jgi:hypothetical protein
MTSPSGEKRRIDLREAGAGRATASVDVSEAGLYRFADGARTALGAVGALNPVELGDVRATEDRLRPLAAASGGQVLWLSDGIPDLRRIRPGRETGSAASGGRSWIGLQANGDHVVAGVTQTPLVPALALFLLGLGALVAAWRREGR